MDKVQVIGKGFAAPQSEKGKEDLAGYKPKPKLKKAPYVKDASGFIWQYEPWMADMGDVLQPCWQAPPKAKIQVALSAADIEAYGRSLPQRGESRKPEPARPKRKVRRARRAKPEQPETAGDATRAAE